MAEKAVKFIHDKYLAGEIIDGYTAFVLTLAGEDMAADKWRSNGKTVRGEIENLADLLGNNNSLIDYITATQNPNGSFGPYANEYGTKAPLQALAMVKSDFVCAEVQAAISGAVNYFKTGYSNGSFTYEVSGWGFDYRCVEALAKAGEDLGQWVNNGKTLKEVVIGSADNTAASIITDPLAEGAVYLAKELTVLCAVYPASDNIKVLAGAVVDKQNPDGSFGSNIYDHVMILAALGKAGKAGSIDQNTAVSYIDSLKQKHENSWGIDAGVAWGYASDVKEPDLTAQVITALSYMVGVDDPAIDVDNLVQEGLAYLADIQDVDTAAIPAEWDATFATAETLIALKSLGMSYNDYAGSESTWVKKSKTKTIAQCLLALNKWNDLSRRDQLVDLLSARQKQVESGKGSFENSVYSDMWAYLALGEAGKIGEFNTGDVIKNYILFKQNENGSWGETFGSYYYPDFLSTTQAIRALTYLPGASNDDEIQAAIENGLTYLKGLQQYDGGVYDPWDDPAVDNSEIIITLHKLDIDPKGAEWTITVGSQGLNPVSYLMTKTMNADGSFGTSRNIFGATVALYAYLYEIEETGGGGSDSDSGRNPPATSPAADEYTVNIAVVGKNGELLFGPGPVVVSKTGNWGLTALGALHVTGLSYTHDGGFVKSIAGQANSGMSGWMYKVNNSVPASLAIDYRVNQGDRVIWWYSTDPNSSGPTWDSLGKVIPIQEKPVTMEDAIKGATELQSKIADGSLKPSEAVNEIAKLMSGMKNELASPATKTADASKTLRYIMENTLSALINSSNATPIHAVAALRTIVNEGIKTVLARLDAGEVAGELKSSLATQVSSIITKASTIPVSQMEVSSTSTTTMVTLPVGMLKQRLEQVGQVQKELQDILSGEQLHDVALQARAPVQNLIVDLAGLAEQKENTELKVTGDAARNLRGSGLKLAVIIDNGFTITLSGKERAGRPATAAANPVMLASHGDTLRLLASQGEPASNNAEGYMLSVSRLEAAKATGLVQDAKKHSNTLLTLRPMGKAYTIAIKDLDNKNVVTLADPLEMKLSYRGLTKNPELTGIYSYQEGKFVFTGAKTDRLKEFISAGVITGGTFTLLEYDRRFSDLAGHWAEEDIRRLSAKHIVGGMSESSFGPELTATRAQCAALLVRALNLPESKATPAFTDVPDSAWYAGDVAAAAGAGIIKGTSTATFSPDKNITRAELAVMISRIIQGEQRLSGEEVNKVLAMYTDAGKIPAWARSGMALAAETGIIRGRTAETIVPEGIINRAEVAVIIGRLLEEIDK